LAFSKIHIKSFALYKVLHPGMEKSGGKAGLQHPGNALHGFPG